MRQNQVSNQVLPQAKSPKFGKTIFPINIEIFSNHFPGSNNHKLKIFRVGVARNIFEIITLCDSPQYIGL